MTAQNNAPGWQARQDPAAHQAALNRVHADFLESDRRVREALRAILPRAARGQIAVQLGLTPAALDSYCSHGAKPKARLPACLVPRLTELLGDERLAFAVAGKRLGALARLGRALVELGEIDATARRLAAQLQRNGRRRKKARGRG